MTGIRIVLPIHIPDDLGFRKIELVGQYALQFEWSDGIALVFIVSSILRDSVPCGGM